MIKTPQGVLVEPTQKVPAGRRIRDPIRAQHPAHRFAGLKVRDVLETRVPGAQVVHVRQDVIGLTERTVSGKEGQLPVQITRDAQAPHQDAARARPP